MYSFLKAFLVLMKLSSLSQFYAPKFLPCFFTFVLHTGQRFRKGASGCPGASFWDCKGFVYLIFNAFQISLRFSNFFGENFLRPSSRTSELNGSSPLCSQYTSGWTRHWSPPKKILDPLMHILTPAIIKLYNFDTWWTA